MLHELRLPVGHDLLVECRAIVQGVAVPDRSLTLQRLEAGFIQGVWPHVPGRYGLLLEHVSGVLRDQATSVIILRSKVLVVLLAATRRVGH